MGYFFVLVFLLTETLNSYLKILNLLFVNNVQNVCNKKGINNENAILYIYKRMWCNLETEF